MKFKPKGVTKKIMMSTAVAGMLLAAPVFASEASAYTINVHQLLNRGDRGQSVSTLQEKLDALNYYGYAIDGLYGPITTGAVRNYQEANDLVVDGIAGPVTLGSLFGGNSQPATETTSIHTVHTLQIGDQGEAVRNLQTELRSLDFYSGALDGKYGPITTEAVRHFQRANDLAVDGIAGPNTLGALAGNPVSASSSGDSSVESDASSSSSIVSIARSLIGTPYQWGGTSPSGFDCSGFLNYVYDQVNVSLPRTTNSIWYNAGSKISSPNTGDIVFFEDTYNTNRTATHAGIYIGDGNFVHAGSDGVEISNLNGAGGYWQSHYLGAKSIG